MTLTREWNNKYSTTHQFSLKQYQHSARSGIAIAQFKFNQTPAPATQSNRNTDVVHNTALMSNKTYAASVQNGEKCTDEKSERNFFSRREARA